MNDAIINEIREDLRNLQEDANESGSTIFSIIVDIWEEESAPNYGYSIGQLIDYLGASKDEYEKGLYWQIIDRLNF
jgi:hypothetical protein